MSEIAGSFYTNLYTPTPPDAKSMRVLLDQITPDMRLDGEQQSLLELPIELDDFLFECKRSSKYASPGSEAALKKEFSYKGKRVMVSRTYPKETTIIRVSVSNLPYNNEEKLKAQMSKIFGAHGEILKMGLLHTLHGHFLLIECLSL